MILKFYAKGAQLVRVPGAQPLPKQPDMYVGRTFDSETRGYPADDKPFEIDSESESGRRLARLARIDNCLYAANQETADACGIGFVSVKNIGGSFVENIADKPVKSPNKSTDPQ